ncbi:MAG: hypothetical protein ACK55Z_33940, partial [bacterium]
LSPFLSHSLAISLANLTRLLNIRKLGVPLLFLNHAHRLEFLQYTCPRSHTRQKQGHNTRRKYQYTFGQART